MRPLLSQEEVEALLRGFRSDESETLHEPILLTIELGQQRLLIQDLSQLHPGSVVDLPQRIGESCKVWVNHKLVAYGEVVAVDGRVAVYITRRLHPTEC
ncbi:MAG: FliM/FliN family flagellar motor switch protein [Candidatus Tectomicrobia bacterium]|nr:FliM/FliN family flagellar motor switch protein [Candidatus Tectomicrobia bacterium]